MVSGEVSRDTEHWQDSKDGEKDSDDRGRAFDKGGENGEYGRLATKLAIVLVSIVVSVLIAHGDIVDGKYMYIVTLPKINKLKRQQNKQIHHPRKRKRPQTPNSKLQQCAQDTLQLHKQKNKKTKFSNLTISPHRRPPSISTSTPYATLAA